MRDGREDFERRLDRASRQQGGQTSRTGGLLIWLAFILVGVLIAPFLYVAEFDMQIFSDLRLQGEEYLAQLRLQAPEEYQAYVPYAVIAVVLILVLALRGPLLWLLRTSRFLIGIVLGALIWVPFGPHIRAAVPQFDDQIPGLQAGIDRVAEANALTLRLQAAGRELVPIPGQPAPANQTAAGEDAAAAPSSTANEGTQ